jgi:hypothetical protein
MAKYEKSLTGNFADFLNHLHNDITGGSMSATYEDGSDMRLSSVQMAVRVYERYSMVGGNRVSMNVTILGSENSLYLSAITSGGSKAVFFKINTFGEETFLEQCIDSVERYIAGAR